MTKQVATCGTCSSYDLDKGYCRRNPPVVQDNRHAFWPRTHWDDWCKKWTKRRKEK